MASVLVIKETISPTQFKYNYLKNQKHFMNFLFHFWNLHQISNFFKKNMNLIAQLYALLLTAKVPVTEMYLKAMF